MRFIKKVNLVEACKADKYKKALPKALTTVKLLSGVDADSINDLKKVFGSKVDYIPGHDVTCFDLSPDACRLITYVGYKMKAVFFREVLTHEEYHIKYVDKKKRR